MKMAGFNGKVRCVESKNVCEDFVRKGDILEFKNGLARRNDGSYTAHYESFEEFIHKNPVCKFELVTEEFTKADLKTGMRVKTRNGEMWVVLKDVEAAMHGHQDLVLVGNRGFLVGKFYDAELKRTDCDDSNSDIMQVFKQPRITDILKTSEYGESIWKRHEPRKMTKAEAEKYISEQLDEVVVIEGAMA